MASVRNDGERGGPSWPLVTAVALFCGFAFLGSRGLGDPDEGRYAAAALEMLVAGDALTPTLDGVPHLTKPPLAYWCAATGMAALGRNEWGARAATGAAHVLTALVVAAFGASLAGGSRGRLAGIVYATMLTPFAAASLLTPDPLLTLFETATAFFLWRTGGERGTRLDPLLAWVAAGLAVMTKGPVGLLPFAVFAGAALLDRTGRVARSLRRAIDPGGLLLFAAIATPWFALADAIHPGLFERLVGQELLGRAITGGHGRNAQWYQPLKIWVLPLTIGCLPWSAAWLGRSFWRKGTKRATRSAHALLAVWVALPIVFFAFLPTRQILYVLPVFPAIALATALRWTARRSPLESPARFRLLLTGWLLFLAALRVASANWPTDRDIRAAAAAISAQVREAAGDTTVAVALPNMHGLGFYLERAPNRDLARALASSSQRVVVLAKASDADRIEKHALEAGRSVRAVEWREGRVLLVAELVDFGEEP